MKLYRLSLITLAMAATMTSCSDWLEQEPPSKVTPDGFINQDTKILAAVDGLYTDILPSHHKLGNSSEIWCSGIFGWDNNTDNQMGRTPANKYGTNLWLVSSTNSDWKWTNIRNVNYWLSESLKSYEAKTVSGSDATVRQYIGELYFLRAFAYFDLMQKFGDLPILKEPFEADEAMLVEADKRSPCNEVARFILSDLDEALNYLAKDGFESRHTRISYDAAMLLKSRVALYEASWLRYFAGTPFVPGDAQWPGAKKNSSFAYTTGSVEKESEYFYKVAAEAAEQVADKYQGELVKNTGVVPQSESDPANPYMELWGSTDLSSKPEVLLWREYNSTLGVVNNVEVSIQFGNYNIGVTRGMVETYLMKDGKPRYDSEYTYDDSSIAAVAKDRDPRLSVFLKVPGQKNAFRNMSSTADHVVINQPMPDITNGSEDKGYSTGYALRKGGTFDRTQCVNGGGSTAAVVFRATEALLNYMEAEYELTKNVNSGKILSYWKTVRECAGFTGSAADPMTTINATDMSREDGDWGAYSAGKKLTDAVLYNIRRERKSELVAEGLRWMDLQRWRSLDQLMANPVHIEGINLWGSDMHNDPAYSGKLFYYGDGSGKSATTSSPRLSNYLRPQEINTINNSFLGGLTWHMAHYLEPLPIRQFLLTASDHATVENSVLYQNPYWPTVAGHAAEK